MSKAEAKDIKIFKAKAKYTKLFQGQLQGQAIILAVTIVTK